MINFLPEWAPQSAMLLGFPAHPEMWGEDYIAAQKEAAALAHAISAVGATQVHLLTHDAAGTKAAQEYLKALGANQDAVQCHAMTTGDVWLRDTAPLFVKKADTATIEAQLFRFNGWGFKYLYENDRDLAGRIAQAFGHASRSHDFVLEGGSLDADGTGTFLTTAECLENANRNPHFTRAQTEAMLKEALGCTRLVWLQRGLLFDHTDGHIDNLARFVAPGHVVTQSASGADDPQAEIFKQTEEALRAAGLNVSLVPSPGRVLAADGAGLAASHMNFIICNRAVIVPLYNTPYDEAALAALRPLFPSRKIVGLPALNILRYGGGSFHCMSQQIPA